MINLLYLFCLALGATLGVIALFINFDQKLTVWPVFLLIGIVCSPIFAAVCQIALSSRASRDFSQQLYEANSKIRYDDIYAVIEFNIQHSPPYVGPLFKETDWILNLTIGGTGPGADAIGEVMLSSRSSQVIEEIPPFEPRYQSNSRSCLIDFRLWSGDLGRLKYPSAWNGATIRPSIQTDHGTFYFLNKSVENDEGIDRLRKELAEEYVREYFGEDAVMEDWDLDVVMFPTKIKVSIYVENRRVGESSGHIYFVRSSILGERNIQSDHQNITVAGNTFVVDIPSR